MNGLHSSALTAGTDNLARYMDLLSARQKLVASNLANADTPGFHTKDIDFQFEYMSLLRGQQPATMEPEGLYEKPDGNNVNVDRESRLLAENTIRFNLATNLVRGNLETIRKAIHEGR
jgi:flagellar basal-body rod protein FlgB